LDKQNRMKDQTWNNIMGWAWIGECNTNDLHEIEKLVLTNPEYTYLISQNHCGTKQYW
jgi:hypothetical protein